MTALPTPSGDGSILLIDDDARLTTMVVDYLQANGIPRAFQNWINTGEITDVSPDGRILVGWGAAPAGFRGYMVILGDKP